MLTKEESERVIQELQRDLINEIMGYSIKYGSDSIAWNVNINFIRKKGRGNGGI